MKILSLYMMRWVLESVTLALGYVSVSKPEVVSLQVLIHVNDPFYLSCLFVSVGKATSFS